MSIVSFKQKVHQPKSNNLQQRRDGRKAFAQRMVEEHRAYLSVGIAFIQSLEMLKAMRRVMSS